jgi:ATP/maltotriose-dependent transcriptional regulator MalT
VSCFWNHGIVMTISSSSLPGKLNRPQPGARTLIRTRLFQQIDKSLQNSVTTIVAPAGFGKTVLLASWMAQSTWPVAWLALDVNDNHLPTFARYLALAIETRFPASCRETLSLAEGLYPPSLAQLTDCLLAELADLPESIILILDDFHVLVNPEIHSLVASLIDHLPHRLHLIIDARGDPPLPLARWRLKGQLGEIRMNDLRFSLIEARELLQLLLEVEIPPGANEAIAARTEGWAAGLRLTALSLQGQTDLSTLRRDSLGQQRYIMDYLMEEVFARQTPALQALLLRSSILNWMTEPLLTALASVEVQLSADATPESVPVSLSQLLGAGLFIELVSEYEGMYRYHDLFRDLLRQRLMAQATPQAISTLHQEASRWLADNGYFEEAVRHALAAGDPLAAARVVEGQIHALLNQEAKRQMEALLNLLPQQLSEERAPLLIARAWLMHFEQRMNAIAPLLQRAEQLLLEADDFTEVERRRWQGDFLTLRSQEMFWRNHYSEARDLGMQAVAILPLTSYFVRGLAFYHTGLSLHFAGDTAAAQRLLREQLEQSTPASVAADMRLLLGLCIIRHDALQFEQLRSTALIMLRQAEASGLLISKAWAHSFLGKASYEANDLTSAQFHFLAGAALRHTANGMCSHECLVGLALTYAAQSQGQRAAETALTLITFDSTPLAVERLVRARSLQVRLALLREDRESARRWLLHPDLDSIFYRMPLLEITIVTYIKTLLAMDSSEDTQQALNLAQQLQREAESSSSELRLVLALTLQALALDALHEGDRALVILRNAIGLGQPGRLIRTFVDFGPTLGDLLRRLLKSGLIMHQEMINYVVHLLAEFPAAPDASPALSHPEIDGSLIEPLTAREVQVLELVAQRLTDREIADTLVISPFTVRRHLDNIGEKIGVRSRRAMVERAYHLNLIPPESV